MENLTTITQQILGEPFEWIAIPAGEFLMGANRQQDKYVRRNEPDMQTAYLPSYAIAKYPITYSQFQKFIDAPHGIGDDQWWVGLAEPSKTPFEQKWKLTNRPRERVNWYQAIAFCRWLSFQLWARLPAPQTYDPMNAATWLVRLPTEAEWEKTARGTDGRIYPWGHQVDSEYTTTNESEWGGKTSYVTMNLSGRSPYGVVDMSGNVWEWGLGKLDDFSSVASQIHLTHADPRLLRGGSWRNSLREARTTYRHTAPPTESASHIGFRPILDPLFSNGVR